MRDKKIMGLTHPINLSVSRERVLGYASTILASATSYPKSTKA